MFRHVDTILPIFTHVFVHNLVTKSQLKLTCLVILVKLLLKQRKSQSDITSFFKKFDRNQKNDDDIIYVGGMCLYLPF